MTARRSHDGGASQPLLTDPVVVALHCSCSSGRQWLNYPAECPSHWRWRMPNLLGYAGQNALPFGHKVTLGAEASRIAPLLPADTGAHLAGHAYGAAVALQLALRLPQRVHSLTLYEPACFALLRPASPALLQEMVDHCQRITALVHAGDTATAAQEFVSHWCGPGAWATFTAERRQTITSSMPKVQLEFQALFMDTIEPGRLARLRMPVRVVYGQHSPRPTREIATIVAQHCPEGQLVQLRDADHLTPIESPARFAAALLAHEALPLDGGP
jgi:pimeloyl-ACP methyl ester carboxylesterase